jgi:class 3 adenylate cyclase
MNSIPHYERSRTGTSSDSTVKPSPAQFAITSEKKLVSIVFADLSGFTTLSEKLGPERITEIVNLCFKRLGKIVYEFEGYIDKFMGDCIMALFGAPIAHENDPELAILCALKMLKELHLINEELNLDLEMSVGINSGVQRPARED